MMKRSTAPANQIHLRPLTPYIWLVVVVVLAFCAMVGWYAQSFMRGLDAMCLRDWITEFQLDGILYRPIEGTLPLGDRGSLAGTITFEQATATSPEGCRYPALEDGHSTTLPIGTEIYALKSYSPSFRLAIAYDDRLYLYEVSFNPRARSGRDLLDIDGKVETIDIYRVSDEPRATPTVQGAIVRDDDIDRFVEALLAAPVGDAMLTRGDEETYVITFGLEDGTKAHIRYLPRLRRADWGLDPAEPFHTIFQRALVR